MTWAERVGDLGTNIALVAINFVRIATLLAHTLSRYLDDLVTNLGERSEQGLRPAEVGSNAWAHLPTNVLWGIAAIVLRVLSIATVLFRQLTGAADGFLRELAEGQSSSTGSV